MAILPVFFPIFDHSAAFTHIERASHERGSLAGLLHDLEEVGGRLAEVKHFRDSACEVLHRLRRVTALQRLVTAHQSENGAPWVETG